MALYATNRFPGDGATTSYEVNFVGKYIARSHVKVYQEDNKTKVRTYVSINDSNFLNDTTLYNLPVTPVGSTLVIYRDTPKAPIVDFVNGARFTEYNLDLVARQGLFVAMEAMDNSDAESRQGLLDAIAAIMALFHDLDVAVTSAQAAAVSATSSAATALSAASTASSAAASASASASAATTARTKAQTAATQATTSATNAANSASAASTSATAAGSSASTAAASAATATAQADAADSRANAALGSAQAAASSASAASDSATAADAARVAAQAAAASVVSTPLMACCLVYGGSPRIVSLRRWGGTTIMIDGMVRTLPESGLNINAGTDTTTVYNVYAYWTGSAVAVTAVTSAPIWRTEWGYWCQDGNTSRTYVGSFVGGLIDGAPMEYIRSAYHGPTVIMQADGPASSNVAWGGTVLQISRSALLIPGDGIEATVNSTAISDMAKGANPAKHLLKYDSTVLHSTDTGWPSAWQYIPVACQWSARRDINAAPTLFNLNYVVDASSTTGGTVYCERSRLISRTYPLFR